MSEHLTPPQDTPHIDERFEGVLIGGGIMYEEGKELLRAGLEQTGADGTPNVLWVPSSAGYKEFHDRYDENFKKLYREEFGVNFDVLHPYALLNPEKSRGNDINPLMLPSHAEAEDKILSADNLVITGGNPIMMNRLWQAQLANGDFRYDQGDSLITGASNIKKLIEQFYKIPGRTITGQSAGLNIFAEAYHSDTQSYVVDEGERWKYRFIENADEGLGHLAVMKNVLVVPHYNKLINQGGKNAEGKSNMIWREHSFDAMFERRGAELAHWLGLAVDDLAAVQFIAGGDMNILEGAPVEHQPGEEWKNRRNVTAIRINQETGKLDKRVLEPDESYRLEDLAA